MPKPHPLRPRQQRQSHDPFFNAGIDIAAEWEAHLDAGRIANHHRARPQVVANRTRNATLFLRFAKEARR